MIKTRSLGASRFFYTTSTLFHYFSINIAIASIGVTMMAARLFNTHLDAWVYLILGLTVWSIYSLDHVLDISSANQLTPSTRYLLYRTYQTPLRIGVLSTSLVAGFLALRYLPLSTLIFGLILLAVVTLHLSLIKRRCYAPFKSIMNAAIYTAGTFGIAYYPLGRLDHLDIMIIGLFMSLVVCNAWIYAYYDYEEDHKMGVITISSIMTKSNLYRLTNILLGLSICTGIGLVFFSHDSTQRVIIWTIIAMLLAHVPLLIAPSRFKRRDYYFKYAELIFYLAFIHSPL